MKVKVKSFCFKFVWDEFRRISSAVLSIMTSPSHNLLQNFEKLLSCPKILKKLPEVDRILQNVAQKLLIM